MKITNSITPAEHRTQATHRRRMAWRKSTMSGVWLLLLTLWLVACSNRTQDAKPAPAVTFRTLNGETLPLAEVGKPLLVNFWSTTCVICIKELPHLAKLQRELEPRGFELMAVAMPYDPPNAVVNMVRDLNWRFPVAIDIDGAVLEGFEPVDGTPTSFLISTDGNIVKRYVGAIDMDKLRAAVESLLDAAST